MLTRCPSEVCGDGDASEAVFFDGKVGGLAGAVFEEGAEPGVDIAGDVDGCCGDEVIPLDVSIYNVEKERGEEGNVTMMLVCNRSARRGRS